MNASPSFAVPTNQTHPRVDGRLKVTGQARYTAEYKLPGMAYAALVQSTIPAGRVRVLDTAEAERAPGVLGVLTHRNMPRLKTPPSDMTGKGQPGEPYVPMQDDVVQWNGQHLAVVVAETLEEARYAATLVRVEYDEAEAKLHLSKELPNAENPALWAGREKLQVSRGHADIALDRAEVTMEQTYNTATMNHNPMEPFNTTAFWEGPDRLLVHDTTRWIKGIQRILANAFSLKLEDVRVICPFVGGAFGSKGFQWQHPVLAAAAARLVGRPVRLEFRRQEMFTTAGRRAATVQRYALGSSADGRLEALRHVTLTSSSPILEYTEPAGNQSRNMYSVPNLTVSHQLVRLNQPSPCPMRGPGEATGNFAMECAMDELAYQLGVDPVELRLKNYAETDEHEEKPYSSKHLRECYARAAEKFGWSRRNPEPRSMRSEDGRLLVGWGMATSAYPAVQMACQAQVSVYGDGTASARSATHEVGTGTYTGMSQIVASALSLPVDRVRFDLGDSLLPTAPNNGGSWLTASVGTALLAACASLKKKLAKLAADDRESPLAGTKADELAFQDGKLVVAAEPSRGMDVGEIVRRAGLAQVMAEGASKPGENGEERFAHHSFGAAFAEVTVDPDLGEVRLRRFVGVYDAGRILNPQLARSQLLGGTVFGLSMALQETSHLDPQTGRVVNANLGEYHVPVCADIPTGDIDVSFLGEPDLHFAGALGAHGIGELGIVGSVAAIANAVYHATGNRVRDLPITADKLL